MLLRITWIDGITTVFSQSLRSVPVLKGHFPHLASADSTSFPLHSLATTCNVITLHKGRVQLAETLHHVAKTSSAREPREETTPCPIPHLKFPSRF